MTALLFSYLAGILTTLNPCVLPLLPLVLAGTLQEHRWGPVAFTAGLTLAFTAAGLFLALVGLSLGITPQHLRTAAAILFLLFGAVLLIAPLQARFAAMTAGLANHANTLAAGVKSGGLRGPFLVGALAGALWSPCSGPSLGAALALAAEAGGILPAAARMLAFGLGAGTILMLLAYGSRAAILKRRNALMGAAGWIKPVAGAVFIVLGFAVLLGWDKALETWIVERLPDSYVNFTARF